MSSGASEPWEEKWAAGRTGWDQGQPHTPLVRFLKSEKAAELEIPKEGRALVPGCGLGYDVLLFAQRGLDATGLDISPTGAAAARKWLEGQSSDDSAVRSRVRVTLANFFEYHPKTPEEQFDLIYDYTFLCALDPSLREGWAKQMTALARPGPSSRLITLMFPLNGKDGGPPYSLSEEIYHQLLDGRWELMWSEDVPQRERRPGMLGGEKLAVWRLR